MTGGFPRAAAKTIASGAPSTKEFPGGRFSDSVASIIASYINQFKEW